MPELSKVALFTNEYPPHVYGGAGVHVEYLSRELARLVRSRCAASATRTSRRRQPLRARLPALGRDQAAAPTRASWARSTPSPAASRWRRTRSTPTSSTATPGTPTWAASWPGQLWGVPYVLTIHSLEPLRPWKVEQLGNAYHLSAWMERTAHRAGRRGDRRLERDPRRTCCALFNVPPERVHVIHNGIDLDEYRPTPDTRRCSPATASTRRGPIVLFVGRITRQKGIIHLVNAIPRDRPGAAGRALRRRARHARDRPRDGRARGGRVSAEPRRA